MLVDLCFLFLFPGLFTVVWEAKNPVYLLNFLSDWSLNFVIIIMVLFNLLNCIMVDYFILLYRYHLFCVIFIILFLFSFSISCYFYFCLLNSSWSWVTFAVFSRIFVIVFIIFFIIIFLSQKCRVKNNSFIFLFL